MRAAAVLFTCWFATAIHTCPFGPGSTCTAIPCVRNARSAACARCSICLEGSDVDDERVLTTALFCDPSADDGWGYSLCCRNIFHYTCLLAQKKPRQADYVTRQGRCDIATDCPSCRSEIYGTRRRLLNRGPQGGEPPRRNESLRAQRARKGF